MKRRYKDHSDDEDDYDSDEFSDSDSKRRRHEKKKKRKKKTQQPKTSHKKSHKKDRRRHRENDDCDIDDSRHRSSRSQKIRKEKDCSPGNEDSSSNHYGLANALCNLMEERPVFCSELPIILIRLVGGATFNLQQMTDEAASIGLSRVFDSLRIFGVQKSNENLWMFRPPSGASNRDERVLLKVIRSILDEIGITISAIEKVESEEYNYDAEKLAPSEVLVESEDSVEKIKLFMTNLLAKFQSTDPKLGEQLVELCGIIISGESLCIDGIENENLKNSLASIFIQMGLEKSEMEYEDSDAEENDEENNPMTGYGLPEINTDQVKLNLAAFMETCQNPSNPPLKAQKRRVLGPQLAPNDLNEDDEGPAQFTGGPKAPFVSRARQHASQALAEDEREEWMLVPGKHDFLSSIKSGQSIKSRGFKNQKAPEQTQEEIHPAIQKELDSIMEAHKAARGPSLLKQHREKKQSEKQEAAAKKSEWKWNRNKDLDAGRRVDKDALKMVLGGAASNLQSKFQGGFNR
jgi:hypothetical protein